MKKMVAILAILTGYNVFGAVRTTFDVVSAATWNNGQAKFTATRVSDERSPGSYTHLHKCRATANLLCPNSAPYDKDRCDNFVASPKKCGVASEDDTGTIYAWEENASSDMHRQGYGSDICYTLKNSYCGGNMREENRDACTDLSCGSGQE